METDQPVWTIRPNWRGGVMERLEWLTDVIAGDTGIEQRRSVRLSPRRSFEFTVNPTHGERTYLDLVMHRLGAVEWLLPLWHDQGRLGAASGVGLDSLEIDTTFREFRDGDYALLYGDTFTWEVVLIAEVRPNSLDLVNETERSWPRGTRVYPLRLARLSDDSAIQALTSRVGQAQVLFTINEANDYEDMLPDDVQMYLGRPMILTPPDRSREINTNHVRLTQDMDGQVGLVHRVDTAGRAFSVQAHNWMVRGRKAQHDFRRLMYHLRGRQRMAWLPTFNEDVTISRPVAVGETGISIEKIGIGYVGGPIPGRTRIWTGKEILLHAAMGAAPSDREERLALTAPTAASYAVGASGSFLEAVRLDTDTIELQHHTDSDGVFECGVTFRAFANDREAPLPIMLPKPTGVKSAAWCGQPEDDNPCRRILPDWEWRYIYQAYRSGPFAGPYIGQISGFGGRHEWESYDAEAQRWSFVWYDDVSWDPIVPPGSGVGWQFSFPFGSDNGTSCRRQDQWGNCVGEVYLQHKTWIQPKLVATGPQFFVGPQEYYWIMPQP